MTIDDILMLLGLVCLIAMLLVVLCALRAGALEDRRRGLDGPEEPR